MCLMSTCPARASSNPYEIFVSLLLSSIHLQIGSMGRARRRPEVLLDPCRLA